MSVAEFLDRPIAFQRSFVELGAGITGALMLSQAVYWSRRVEQDAEGWFHKKQSAWQDETGLSRTEQETARKRLVSIGVLQEVLRGAPAKLYYRVDYQKLEHLLMQAYSKPVCRKPANKDAGNPQAGSQEPCKQDCGEHAGKSALNPQTNIDKTTAETTADISAPEAVATGASQELAALTPEQKKEAFKQVCRETWAAYAAAYAQRYGTQPVRNEKVNKNVQDLVKRLGKEAPLVAEFFVLNVNESFVVRRCHAFGDLLAQCEAYRTQWWSGYSMTHTQAQQADKTQSNLNVAEAAAAKAREIIERREREAQEDAQEGGSHAQ